MSLEDTQEHSCQAECPHSVTLPCGRYYARDTANSLRLITLSTATSSDVIFDGEWRCQHHRAVVWRMEMDFS